jgi:hypothetical protein
MSGDINLPKILRNPRFNVSPDMNRKTKFYTKKEQDAYRSMKVKMDTVVDRVYYKNNTNTIRQEKKINSKFLSNSPISPIPNPRSLIKNDLSNSNSNFISNSNKNTKPKFFDFINLSKDLGRINIYERNKGKKGVSSNYLK